MDEPIRLAEKHHLQPSPQHIVLYMMNLMITGHYLDVINLQHKYSAIIDASISRAHGIIVTAYTYLFMKKADEALTELSKGPELASNELLHIRYVYLIAFLVRGQYDLALAEVKNLKRMLTATAAAHSLQSDLAIAGYFQTYIRALEKDKTGNKKILKKLKTEIREHFDSHKPLPHHNMQLDWLAKQLEQED